MIEIDDFVIFLLCVCVCVCVCVCKCVRVCACLCLCADKQVHAGVSGNTATGCKGPPGAKLAEASMMIKDRGARQKIWINEGSDRINNVPEQRHGAR